MIAASVVAAHNNALRSWLRSDGQGDATTAVDHALDYVKSAFGTPPTPPAPTPSPAPSPVPDLDETDDVVVVVSRRGAPMWRVVQEIESTLAHLREN